MRTRICSRAVCSIASSGDSQKSQVQPRNRPADFPQKTRYFDLVPDQNPVALVTGGAARVGKAIVFELAGAGFDVLFTYLTSPDSANLVERVQSVGRRGFCVQADFRDPQRAVSDIAGVVEKQSLAIQLIVNNASRFPSIAFDDTDLSLARELMAIHYETPLLLTQRFAPMLRASRGSIVNMLDTAVERPFKGYAAYSASKSALWNLTLSLARELAPEVTVNGIAPGVVEWPDDYPESERKKYLSRVPLRRSGSPQDVASLVRFLTTEGKYITGQIIRVDGGRSIV